MNKTPHLRILLTVAVLLILMLSACSKVSHSTADTPVSLAEGAADETTKESAGEEEASAHEAEKNKENETEEDESIIRTEEDDAFKEELDELVDEFKEEVRQVTEGFIEEPAEIEESMTEYEPAEPVEEPLVSEVFQETIFDDHPAFEGVLSYLNHSQAHTISPYFTDQQIYYITQTLKMPLDQSFVISIGDMYYWEGADTYLCDVGFYENGEYAAGAACIPNTSTLARSIYTYK